MQLLEFSYEMLGKTLGWLHAFLSGRSHNVVLDNSKLKSIPVLSGIPQGSLLGPGLFLLYTNDRSTVRLFADDTLLYITIASEIDSRGIQEDLHNLER